MITPAEALAKTTATNTLLLEKADTFVTSKLETYNGDPVNVDFPAGEFPNKKVLALLVARAKLSGWNVDLPPGEHMTAGLTLVFTAA